MKKLVCGVGNNDADYAVNIRIGVSEECVLHIELGLVC